MALSLYKITNEGIFPISTFNPRDVIIVSDDSAKKLYIYKGLDSHGINEFEAEKLYEEIMQKFLNTHIYIVNTTNIKVDDNSQDKKIKRFIQSNQVGKISYNIGKWIKKIIFLQGFRDQITELKNYNSSNKWKRRLSNLTSLWKLSLFNCIMIFSVIIGLGLKIWLDVVPFLNDFRINQPYSKFVENLTIFLLIGIMMLLTTGIVNLIFVLYPMKFPIKPVELEKLKKSNITED